MQTLKMDFQSQSTPPVVPVMQSDAQSRFIGITLYNGGAPYEAPEGASYTVQYRGPGANNMGWYDTITLSSGTRKAVIVDSTSKNVVTLELAEQALRVNGNVFVNLCVVTNTGYMLKTFPILCRVTGAAFPDTVAVQSFFYVTGITSEQWLAYVTACQDAQKRAEDAAAKFEIDPTLSVSGKAADAAKVGEAVNAEVTRAKAAEKENAKGVSQLKEDLINKNIATLSDVEFEENILDLSNPSDGYITDDGKYQYEPQWIFYDTLIPVKPNTKYYRLVNPAYEVIVCYDNDKNFLSRILLYEDTGTGKDGYFVTPDNCYYVRFQGAKASQKYSEQVYSQIRPTKYVKPNTKATLTVPYDIYANNMQIPVTHEIVCWGDSLTEGANGATPYTAKLAELLGSNYTVINRGCGGDTAEGIACRQGGLPIYLQPCVLSNKAHEAVNVTFKNIIGESVKPMFDASYDGQRTNINGKSYYTSLRGENRQPVLCAYTDGEGQTINRPYYLHYGEYDTLRNKTMVIWSGSNNAPNEETIENVIQKIRAMIAHNGNNNYIVIGLTSLTAMPDVLKCNCKMALAFGIHFLDISDYLRNYALDDLKITKTEQDATDINNGDVPSSLRTDSVHLTSAANEVVANQVNNKGKELGYWK